MIKYTLNRIGISLLTIFVFITVVFFLMKVLPGGSFDTDRVRDTKVIEIILKNYNLDKPTFVQDLLYIQNLVKGIFSTTARDIFM